jgi:hypothetical protein
LHTIKGSIVGYKDPRGYADFFKLVGVSINIAIHRLQAFQDGDLLYEEGTVVRHLNGDPGSNAWDNIAIALCQTTCLISLSRIRRAEHASSFVTHKHDHVKIKQWHINNGHLIKIQ